MIPTVRSEPSPGKVPPWGSDISVPEWKLAIKLSHRHAQHGAAPASLGGLGGISSLATIRLSCGRRTTQVWCWGCSNQGRLPRCYVTANVGTVLRRPQIESALPLFRRLEFHQRPADCTWPVLTPAPAYPGPQAPISRMLAGDCDKLHADRFSICQLLDMFWVSDTASGSPIYPAISCPAPSQKRTNHQFLS